MGRPKNKTYDSLEDHLEDIIFKLFDPELDENGRLVFRRSDSRLTLDEMSIVSAAQDGLTKPITKVGQMKRESKVLANVKKKLNSSGYSDDDLHDMVYYMNNPQRQNVTSKYMSDSID